MHAVVAINKHDSKCTSYALVARYFSRYYRINARLYEIMCDKEKRGCSIYDTGMSKKKSYKKGKFKYVILKRVYFKLGSIILGTKNP